MLLSGTLLKSSQPRSMDIVLTALIICAICSAVVASLRGANGGVWFALGFLLGPLGFALAFTNKLAQQEGQ
jgi:hypothetical protein